MENTAKFLQNNIDLEKCGKDWLCSQNLVSSLAQTIFYKSQNQFFPSDNIPPLESDASLLDLSSKGRCSIPVRSIETWEKRARKLPASVAQLDARPTGDRDVAGSNPAEVGNILSWRLIMKYFLRSFSPFC